METKIALNNGRHIPALGLGTWKAAPGEIGQALEAAIRAGYRHLDCAAIYMNEVEIGNTLKRLFDEGVIARKDLFITSKLWNTHHAHVREACAQTLKDLQLEYLDLYLVHWPAAFKFGGLRLTDDNSLLFDENKRPMFEKVSLETCWHSMEALVSEGLVKSIGVSNYTFALILDLLAYCKIPPAVNQIELHPFLVRPELTSLCKQHEIVLTAYSPLGSGKTGPLQSQTVIQIATKHKKSPAQILIKWSLQHGFSLVPKSSNPARIKENAEVFDFDLSLQEMQQLDALNCNTHFCCPQDFWNFDFTEM